MADIEEYVEDYEVCTFCGQRIKGVVDWSNDGDPYCQGCIADEEATKTDQAYEMYRDNPEYWKKVIEERRYGKERKHSDDCGSLDGLPEGHGSGEEDLRKPLLQVKVRRPR